MISPQNNLFCVGTICSGYLLGKIKNKRVEMFRLKPHCEHSSNGGPDTLNMTQGEIYE